MTTSTRPVITDNAIILKHSQFGESDVSVLALTRRHGLVRMIAKSALKSRKRFSGALELFHHVRIEYTRKNEEAPAFLQSAELLNSFEKMRGNYNSLCLASVLSEVVFKTMEEGGQDEESDAEFLLFGSILKWLSHLTHSAESWVGVVFLLQWFRLQGWLPEAEGVSGIMHVSNSEAHVLCGLAQLPLHKKMGDAQWFTEWCERPPPTQSHILFSRLVRFCMSNHGIQLKSLDAYLGQHIDGHQDFGRE